MSSQQVETQNTSTQAVDQPTESPGSPRIPEAAHVTYADGGAQTPADQAEDGPPPVVIQPAKRQSFAEEVVGYAKQIRGTVLRQPGTKEMGEKILKGEATYNPKELP